VDIKRSLVIEGQKEMIDQKEIEVEVERRQREYETRIWEDGLRRLEGE
jgi:hypothetical protein